MVKTTEVKSAFRSIEGKNIIRNACREILENWPVSHERTMISTPMGKTSVITCGREDLPPLLLLHGTASNSAGWMGDAENWSRDFRLIAADIPGEPGLSEDRRLSPGGSDFSEWLDSLITALGYESVSITGQSLGGFAALKYAIAKPERVERISLLTASGLSPARISYLFKALPLMLLGKWGADKNNRMISYGVEMPQEVYEFGRLVAKYYKPMLEPIPLFSEDELKRLVMPLQYFGGDHDALLDSRAAVRKLEQFVPHAQTNLLSETGHVIIGQGEKILTFMKSQK